MDQSPVVRALMQLTAEVPALVLYAAGIVAALMNRRRFPRPSSLTLNGCSILLATSIVPPIVSFFSNPFSFDDKPTDQGLESFLIIVSTLASLLRGLGLGMLVWAVFAARSPNASAYSGSKSLAAPRGLRLCAASACSLVYIASLCWPAVYESGGQLGPGRVL